MKTSIFIASAILLSHGFANSVAQAQDGAKPGETLKPQIVQPTAPVAPVPQNVLPTAPAPVKNPPTRSPKRDRKSGLREALKILQALTGKNTSTGFVSGPSGSIAQQNFEALGFDQAAVAAQANRNIEPLDTSQLGECGARGLPVSTANLERLSGHNCNINDKDRLTCMVCNIWFEARGESSHGQIAAGGTVMTRLFSSFYDVTPTTDTVCGIVWEPSSYSWTMDSVVSPSERTLPKDIDSAQMRQVIDSARKALCAGPTPYTNYFAWKSVTPDWLNDDVCPSTLVNLGDHNFCAIHAKVDKSLDTVLRAEGLTSNPGTPAGAGSSEAMFD